MPTEFTDPCGVMLDVHPARVDTSTTPDPPLSQAHTLTVQPGRIGPGSQVVASGNGHDPTDQQ